MRESFALLDSNLDAAALPSLGVQATAAVSELRWVGGTTWLVEWSQLTDGQTSLAVVDIASKKPPKILRSAMPMVGLLLYEPSTKLVTLSLGAAPEVAAFDPARLTLSALSVLPKPASYRQIASLPASETRYRDSNGIDGTLSYAYRLRGAAGASLTEDSWIDVPVAAALQLRGVYPNPVAGDAMVSFMLPAAATASLELVDVTGRIAAEQRLGALSAGEHAVRLIPRGIPLKPGMYFVRLVTGGESRSARFVVLR